MTQASKAQLGSVQIEKKVIAEIIASAVSQIEGVSLRRRNLAERLMEALGQKKYPGINIKVGGNDEVSLELKVFVCYGMNIPSVAQEVQNCVKSTVEKTIDLTLKDININIYGIERGQS
jgi:uncharacterized alkaline shock family protein YloU